MIDIEIISYLIHCYVIDGNLMCLESMPKSIEVNIISKSLKNFAVYRPRKDILLKAKIDKPVQELDQYHD